MKALLIKDLRLLADRAKACIFLPIVALIMMQSDTSNAFIIGYLTFISLALVISTFSYDDVEHGTSFLLTLPVSRKDYVQEKYLIGLFFGWGIWLLSSMAVFWYSAAFKHDFIWEQEWLGTVIILIALNLIMSGMIPIYLKFGSEKGMLMMFVFYGAIFAITYVLIKFMNESSVDSLAWLDLLSGQSLVIIAAGAFLLSVAAMGLSLLVSLRIMQRKQF